MRKLILTCLILLLELTVSAQRRVIILRAAFKDIGPAMTDTEAEKLASRASEYFSVQTGTGFKFDITAPFILSENASYYGNNVSDRRDEFLYRAIQEICSAAVGSVQFSDYDCDGDGTVDNVCILFAGEGEARSGRPELIWSQQNCLDSFGETLSVGGRRINSFSVSSEGEGLGTLCHEFAHSLGLEDLYDTDGEGSGGVAEAMWTTTALMDGGDRNMDGDLPPNFNAIDLDILGCGNCVQLGIGEYTLEPIGKSHTYLRANGPYEGEYYLFECRDNEGWDAGIGGSGMLVYHIDKSDRSAGYSDYYRIPLSAYERWKRSEINCRPDRQCADLVEATPEARNVSEIFFPAKGHSDFGSDTRPAFRFLNGTASPTAIVGIRRNMDGSISFKAMEPVKITDVTVFQDAAIVTWKKDDGINGDGKTAVRWFCDGEAPQEACVSGSCITLEQLEPETEYTVEVSICGRDGGCFSASAGFRTKVWRKELQPYIYLGSAEKDTDGAIIRGSRIPLRVCNAADAVSVRWTLDGNEICTGTDGYYVVSDGGLLKAEVLHDDGSTDIIIRKINVK